MKFCSGCGRERRSDERFCPGCGRRLEGSETAVDIVKSATVAPIPPSAPRDYSSFDPFKPISEDNPIPPDSIWATAPYPGPLPKEAFRGPVPRRIRAIGKLRGRPASEIISVLGPPHTISGLADGGRLRQWIKFSAYSGSYHYVLRFDRYDLCIGITKQTG